MIRRAMHTKKVLSSKVNEVCLLGEDAPLGDYCLGYEQGANGLTVCPSPKAERLNAVTARGLCDVRVHRPFGLVALSYNNGATVCYEVGKTPYNISRFAKGGCFSFEYKNNLNQNLLVTVGANAAQAYNGVTGEKLTFTLPYKLYGGVYHCGRLFAAIEEDRQKVVWSGLGVQDWSDTLTGSGYICLGGEAGNIITIESFGDDLLCVREHGFTLIHALADSRSFRIAPSQRLVLVDKKISKGCAVGKRYYFGMGNGLYLFDGDELSLVYCEEGKLSDCGSVTAVGDELFVNCRYCGEECIMRYKIKSGVASYFCKDCSFAFCLDGVVHVIKSEEYYQTDYEQRKNSRLWRSQKLANGSRVTLKRLFITAEKSVKLTVCCDGLRREVSGVGELLINACGRELYLEYDGNQPIYKLVAQTEVIG